MFLPLGGVLVCFCACVSGTKAEEPATPYVWLTNKSRHILLPTESIERPMDDTLLVSASYQGKDYFFYAWVKADSEEVNMTITNEQGENMGELSYRNGSVSFSPPAFFLPFKPEYIIADFQFCFYRLGRLYSSLKYSGFLFNEFGTNRFEDPYTWTVRSILSWDQKTKIITIEKKRRNVLEVVNHVRGYTYTLAWKAASYD